jgi:hypothetical protein
MRLQSYLLIVVIVLLSACAANVRTEHDRAANFAAYRSFHWVAPPARPVKDPVLDSQLLDERMQRAVTGVLLSRGYRRAADAAHADFLVTYHTTSKLKVESDPASMQFGFYQGFPHGVGSVFLDSGDVSSHQEGALIIDIIDARSRRLVWRGWVTARVTQERYAEPELSKAAHTILAQFPPR